MTDNLPDYAEIEPPEEKPVEEYSTHERRAEVWRVTVAKGSPSRVNKAALARRYDVNRSTIYRDFDRLREWAGETLGDDAKISTRAVYEKVVGELLDEGEWKEAWTIQREWNDWLADLGEQHREPAKSEVDVDVEQRSAEIAYTVVREDADLPTDDDGAVDHEALGFTSAPTTVPIEDPGGDADA